MAGAGRQRLLRLPRSADQRSCDESIPLSRRSASGCARCGGVARRIASHGSGCTGWPPTGSLNREILHPCPQAFCRHTPEVGAGCRNWARAVLCGVAPCKCVQLSRLRWRPRQSLASSRVQSFAWRPVTAVAKRRQGGCRPESSEREDNPEIDRDRSSRPCPSRGRQNLDRANASGLRCSGL